MRSFTAGQNDDGVRLSRFCEKICPNMPKSLLHKAFRNKRVKVNGKKQEENYRICQGDFLELYINDEFFQNQAKTPPISTNFSSLKIIYEDNNILLAFKPLGLLCHSDNKNEDNLIDMIISYLISKGEYSPDKETTFTPALCNRIDQGTEGIVIAAKNYKALAEMNELIRNDVLCKKYLCVTNKPVKDGLYTAWHKRDLQSKKVEISAVKKADFKEISTSFLMLKEKNGFYLIECTLLTGRTHQIRAHLAFLGSPIIGDRKYGSSFKGLDSQLLCAYKLTFKEISKDCSLSYLSDKEFTANENSVLKFFSEL